MYMSWFYYFYIYYYLWDLNFVCVQYMQITITYSSYWNKKNNLTAVMIIFHFYNILKVN